MTASRLGYIIALLASVLLWFAFPTLNGLWIVAGVIMIIPLIALLTKPYETKGIELELLTKKNNS